MAAIGIATIYVGYSLGLWGYCLIKGYNVGLKELFMPTWPPPLAGQGNGPAQKIITASVTKGVDVQNKPKVK
jgi:hypothetical protein